MMLLAFLIGILLVLLLRWDYTDALDEDTIRSITASQPCIPTFEDGGGPYYLPDQPFRDDIAPAIHNGDILTVRGQLLTKGCATPIGNAVIDLWQASEEGSYDTEYYRGQIQTNADGFYMFRTVIPKGYGEGTGYRPPHIHFKVHVNGIEQITSQMFFPEAAGRPGFNEEYIMQVEIDDSGKEVLYNGYHNIILP